MSRSVSEPMDEATRRRYLSAMGIPVWVARDAEPLVGTADLAPVVGRVPGPDAEAPVADASDARAPAARAGVPGAQTGEAPDLDALRGQVASCTACALHERRTRTVFGVGAPGARCMIIGEAPGAEEDRRGEPFVGRAGQLLDAMLLACGLDRDSVYIANIVKCRPPGNRDPRPEEAAACAGHLRRQIELVGPKVLVAAGRVAAHNLLGTDRALSRLRGEPQQHAETGLPVLVTYHPAYLLRRPAEKAKSWADLRRLRAMLGLSR